MAGTPISQLAGFLENVPDQQLQAMAQQPSPEVPAYLLVTEIGRPLKEGFFIYFWIWWRIFVSFSFSPGFVAFGIYRWIRAV